MAGKATSYSIRLLIFCFLFQTVKPAASEDNLADYCMRQAILQTEDMFRVDPVIVGIDAR
jgi:hypothetical protein